MTSRTALVLVLAGLLSSCLRLQEDGQYAFTATEVIRDTCGLVTTPESLWDGQLDIEDRFVRLQYELFDTELRGHYKETIESFYLDGTAANVQTEIRGVACVVDMVSIHLDAEGPETTTAFTGTLRVDYLSEARDECDCQGWYSYRAEKTGN